MEKTKNPLRRRNFFWVKRNPVKLTALLYLKEALVAERYEECAELIVLARQVGAQDFEIQSMLEDRRRNPSA